MWRNGCWHSPRSAMIRRTSWRRMQAWDSSYISRARWMPPGRISSRRWRAMMPSRRGPILRGRLDPGVHALSHRSSVLWYLGYPAQAREQIHQALTIAHALAHPYSLVRAHLSAALLYQACREVQAVQASTDAALRLCQEHGFALFRAQAEQAHGWVLVMHGQVEAGLAYLSRSRDAWRATGAKVWQVQWLLLWVVSWDHHTGLMREVKPYAILGLDHGTGHLASMSPQKISDSTPVRVEMRRRPRHPEP